MKYAIGFDFDHTLGLDHGLERTAFYMLAKEFGRPVDPDDPQRHGQVDTLLGEFRAGTLPLEDAVGTWLTSLEVPLEGKVARAVQRFRDISYTLVPKHMEAIEGGREVISRLLERRVSVAILTNGWNPLQQLKVAACGYEVPLVVSGEIGFRKPEPQAFAKLVEVLDVPAGATFYVGDNPVADIEGAAGAGLHGIWFDRGETAYPPDVAPGAMTIHALLELCERLPEIEALAAGVRCA